MGARMRSPETCRASLSAEVTTFNDHATDPAASLGLSNCAADGPERGAWRAKSFPRDQHITCGRLGRESGPHPAADGLAAARQNLEGIRGQGGGIKLARPAEQIMLSDIYRSALGGKPALTPRPDVPARCRISANFGDLFAEISLDVDGAILEKLGQRTVAQTLDRILDIPVLSRLAASG